MTEKEITDINQAYDKLISNLSIRYVDSKNSFIRQTMILNTAILASLISFNKSSLMDNYELYSYLIVLGLLALCILLSLVLIYEKVHISYNEYLAVREHKHKLLLGKKSTATSIFLPTSLFWLFLNRSYYVFFALTICSMVFYALVSL